MLSEVKERLEGPKYNIDFGGRGGGRQGKGIGKSTIQKGAILWKCLNTFVPLCRCWKNRQHVHVHNCIWSLFFLMTGFTHLYSLTAKLAYKETFRIDRFPFYVEKRLCKARRRDSCVRRRSEADCIILLCFAQCNLLHHRKGTISRTKTKN